jgi:tetratricopeptide (TPR) repeat protein
MPCNDETGARARADLLHARARVAALLRDFEAAKGYLQEAEGCDAEPARDAFLRALVCEVDDRIKDALAIARDTLAARPTSMGALQQTGKYLVLLGRRDEALEVLTRGARVLESGYVLLQLADLQRAMRLHAEAEASLARFLELSPLIEPHVARARATACSPTLRTPGAMSRAPLRWRDVPAARCCNVSPTGWSTRPRARAAPRSTFRSFVRIG